MRSAKALKPFRYNFLGPAKKDLTKALCDESYCHICRDKSYWASYAVKLVHRDGD